jgi:hypothetical protein
MLADNLRDCLVVNASLSVSLSISLSLSLSQQLMLSLSLSQAGGSVECGKGGHLKGQVSWGFEWDHGCTE